MTLHQRRGILACAVAVSLLIAALTTASGADGGDRDHEPLRGVRALVTFGYGGIGPAADAGRFPQEAYYYPSGNQFPAAHPA